MITPELIERATALRKPSHAIDCEIMDTLFPSEQRFMGSIIVDSGEAILQKVWIVDGWHVMPMPKPFTASIDAAATLVAKGCGFNLDRYWVKDNEAGGVRWSAHLSFGGLPDNPRRVHEVFDCFSAPVAVTVAALMARAAGDA